MAIGVGSVCVGGGGGRGAGNETSVALRLVC